ncbi:chitinase [Metarhizobium album]|uniref:Chitinase n=1 Tax=Metarhizobium album TaxID=2182425 RepID=A0A2U2DWH1_9HYPH|nr:glycoside hydrolase family 19 protein [Rhizobium album]PWE57675.1 chitinase [Rhizobium album]
MADIISGDQLRAIAKGKVNESNMTSVLIALNTYGARYGLDRPHRLAQFLAQIMHESGSFRYDREIWGPTPAQDRYDVRTDLGNTPARDGDGKKYAGRGPLQVTGKANVAEFYNWCVRTIGGAVPNFVSNPDLINTDPWEGLSALWYWDTRKLNSWADQGDIETVTKRVNGGKNGLPDRIDYYGRAALVLLGYKADTVEAFQVAAQRNGQYKGAVDGDVGPKTRAALHLALVALSDAAIASPKVKAAPVVEETAVAVVPDAIDKPTSKTFGFWDRILSIGGVIGMGGFSFLSDWRSVVAIGAVVVVLLIVGLVLHDRLISTARKIKAAVEGGAR